MTKGLAVLTPAIHKIVSLDVDSTTGRFTDFPWRKRIVISGAHPAPFAHNHPEGLTTCDWMETEIKTCDFTCLQGKQSTHGKRRVAAEDSLIHQLLGSGPCALPLHLSGERNPDLWHYVKNTMTAPWHSDSVHSNLM